MSQAPVNEQELAHATQSKDGYVANISAVNRMVHEGKSFSGNERNCVFLNADSGKFVGASALSGWDMPDDSRGLALTDWDFDGNIDFWVSNRTAPRVRLMKNSLTGTGDWIGFRLAGEPEKNRSAIGARVKVTLKNGRVILRTLKAGEGFASQSTKTLHLGLGADSELSDLTVIWPDGVSQSFPPPSANRYYEISRTSQKVTPLQIPAKPTKPAGDLVTTPHSVPVDNRVRVNLRVPIPAPNVRYRPLDSKEINLFQPAQLTRPVLITLWSESCQTCRKELREFSNNADKISPHLDLLALCIDSPAEAQARAKSYLDEIAFPWKSGFPEVASNAILSAIFNNTLSTLADLPTPSALLVSRTGEVTTLYQNGLAIEAILEDARLAPLQERWLQQPGIIDLLYVPRLMMEHGGLTDATNYISRAHSQLSRHKEYPLVLAWVADELRKEGKLQLAAGYYKTASQLGQNLPVVLNNVAWVFATHPDPILRDGAAALKCARRCVELTGGNNPGYLDTLAAALAESGDFQQAIATAEKARQLAIQSNQNELVPGLEKALALYAQGKPMRE